MSNNERTPLLTADQHADDNGTPSERSEADSTNGIPKTNMVMFLVAISGCILLAALDSTIVTSAYARIGSDMNQLQRASWIATSYMMSLAAFQPLYGKLSDIFGRKSCLLFAHIIFGIGCLACAVANDLTSLVIARMVSGIGGAGFLPVVTIAISDVIPLRQRGTWQGYINLMYSVGTASGAPLGGILVDHLGWRWGFGVQVPVCVLGFIAILLAFPKNPKDINQDANRPAENVLAKLRRIDFLGSSLLVIVVFSLLLGLDRGSNVAWTSPVAYSSLTVAVLGTIGLVIVESNSSLASEPVAPTRFFQNKNLAATYVTSVWLTSIGTATVFQLALYAQVLNRKSTSQASLYILPIIAGLVGGNLAGGILTQKLGKFRALTILAHVGLFFFASLNVVVAYFYPSSWDLAALTSSMAFSSFLAGISFTTLLVAVIASVGSSDQAAATAVSFLFKTLGSVLGLSISSAILQQVLRLELARELSGLPYDIEELIRRVRESMAYIDSLDPAIQAIVRQSYSKALIGAFGYGAFQSALCLLSSLFIRDRSLDSSK